MVQTMKALNTSYPDVVDLFVAQDVYGLPYPPELQCEEDAEGVAVPCKQYVLRITNESTLDADRPEVFISGALHGNERVGPQATIELALLLVEYATTFTSSSVTSDTDHVRRSKAWLHRNDIYDGMISRAVNELWRDHLFQLTVTFHGGMRCVTYEWGAPNHMQGTMNDVVYGVYGGMEDWAYAASWENSFGSDSDSIFTPCTPTQYGPYPAYKTTYNNKTHRAFNILVETSDLKRPAQTALGLRSSLYDVDLQPYVVLLPHDDVRSVDSNGCRGLLMRRVFLSDSNLIACRVHLIRGVVGI
ncbi:hypothetical protein DYB34_008494 [Aphanomyces astaci]|uniref:Peptidase M14 domain-containing protein n=2 Tax=Aphanomyces astaci TaxID=112090 RepID=A0A3R7DG38_APHAT|nr:hypothetical protein DYB34_008494 [Aphanomyces astaci]